MSTETNITVDSNATRAHDMIAADVNRDGLMNSVGMSQDDNTVAWYQSLGTSPPWFVKHVVTTSGGAPVSIVAASTGMNNDGYDD
jgi:hypothetical protein